MKSQPTLRKYGVRTRVHVRLKYMPSSVKKGVSIFKETRSNLQLSSNALAKAVYFTGR